MADVDARCLPRGDLSVHLRDDRSEPAGRLPAEKADHDFVEEELELKENIAITREIAVIAGQIHDLTTEIRDRVARDNET